MIDKTTKVLYFKEFNDLYNGNTKLLNLILKFIKDNTQKITPSERQFIAQCQKAIENNDYKEPHFVLRFVYTYIHILSFVEDISDLKIRQEKVDYCKQLIEKAYQEDGALSSYAKLMLKSYFPEAYEESVANILKEVDKSGLRVVYLLYRYSVDYMEQIQDTNCLRAIRSLYEFFEIDHSIKMASLVIALIWYYFNREFSKYNNFCLDKQLVKKAEVCYDYLIEVTQNYKLLLDEARFMKFHKRNTLCIKLLKQAVKENIFTAKLHLVATYLDAKFDIFEHEYPFDTVRQMYKLVSDVKQDELEAYEKETSFIGKQNIPNIVEVVKTIYAYYQIDKHDSSQQKNKFIRDFLVNANDVFLVKNSNKWEINPTLRFLLSDLLSIINTVDPSEIGLQEDFSHEFMKRYLSNINNIFAYEFRTMFVDNYSSDKLFVNYKILNIMHDNCILNPKKREYALMLDIFWEMNEYLGDGKGPDFMDISEIYNINKNAEMKNEKFLTDLDNKKLCTLIHRIYAEYFVFRCACHNSDSKSMELVTKELEEYISTLSKKRLQDCSYGKDEANLYCTHDLIFLMAAGDYFSDLSIVCDNWVMLAMLVYEKYYKLSHSSDALNISLVATKLAELYERIGDTKKSKLYYKEGKKKIDVDTFSLECCVNVLFNDIQEKAIALLERYR